jgi:hypothetical protein
VFQLADAELGLRSVLLAIGSIAGFFMVLTSIVAVHEADFSLLIRLLRSASPRDEVQEIGYDIADFNKETRQ